MLVVQALAGILLEMEPGDADRARPPVGHVEHDTALADDRLQILRDLIAGRQVGVEIVLAVEHAETRLISASRPSPVLTACSTQCRLITGSMPGNAASTGETWVLGSAPNAVAAPENSLALETIWAWTSSPITDSPTCAGAALSMSIAFMEQWRRQRRSPPSNFRPARHDAAGSDRAAGAAPDAAGVATRCSSIRAARLLVEGAADDLQAERQPVGRQPGRDRDRRQPGEARRHGEHVVQIHRDRVVRLLADGEGGRGRGRRQDAVDPLERGGEIAARSGRARAAPSGNRRRNSRPTAHRCRSARGGGPRRRTRRARVNSYISSRLSPSTRRPKRTPS